MIERRLDSRDSSGWTYQNIEIPHDGAELFAHPSDTCQRCILLSWIDLQARAGKGLGIITHPVPICVPKRSDRRSEERAQMHHRRRLPPFPEDEAQRAAPPEGFDIQRALRGWSAPAASRLVSMRAWSATRAAL